MTKQLKRLIWLAALFMILIPAIYVRQMRLRRIMTDLLSAALKWKMILFWKTIHGHAALECR